MCPTTSIGCASCATFDAAFITFAAVVVTEPATTTPPLLSCLLLLSALLLVAWMMFTPRGCTPSMMSAIMLSKPCTTDVERSYVVIPPNTSENVNVIGISTVGALDGDTLGEALGELDGEMLGLELGLVLGDAEGDRLGDAEGDEEGLADGEALGDTVLGDVDGDPLGLAEGGAWYHTSSSSTVQPFAEPQNSFAHVVLVASCPP